MLIATIVGFGRPLLPIQILWLELFIDLAASVAFEREPAEPDVMTRPPRHISRPLLTAGILGRISLAGAFSAFAALALLVMDPKGVAHGQWLAYTALVCAQAVRAYANRSLTEPLNRLSTNGFLIAAAIAVVVIQVAIPYVPALADAFRAQPLDAVEWALVALIALAPSAARPARAGGHRPGLDRLTGLQGRLAAPGGHFGRTRVTIGPAVRARGSPRVMA